MSAGARRIPHQGEHGLRQFAGRIAGDDQAGRAVPQWRVAAVGPRGDDRQPRGHRFEQRQGHLVNGGREYEKPGCRQQGGDIVPPAVKDHVVLQPEFATTRFECGAIRPIADEVQTKVRRAVHDEANGVQQGFLMIQGPMKPRHVDRPRRSAAVGGGRSAKRSRSTPQWITSIFRGSVPSRSSAMSAVSPATGMI